MAVMTQEIKESFEKAQVVAFGTADAQGQPNVNIIAIKKIIDDSTLYLSDQFFNKTLANLQVNPQVSVAFWGDGFAYQIHGTARYVNEGEEFEPLKAWGKAVFEHIGIPFEPKGGAFVTVDAIYQMSSGPGAGAQLA